MCRQAPELFWHRLVLADSAWPGWNDSARVKCERGASNDRQGSSVSMFYIVHLHSTICSTRVTELSSNFRDVQVQSLASSAPCLPTFSSPSPSTWRWELPGCWAELPTRIIGHLGHMTWAVMYCWDWAPRPHRGIFKIHFHQRSHERYLIGRWVQWSLGPVMFSFFSPMRWLLNFFFFIIIWGNLYFYEPWIYRCFNQRPVLLDGRLHSR